jgi:hypothetical protein
MYVPGSTKEKLHIQEPTLDQTQTRVPLANEKNPPTWPSPEKFWLVSGLKKLCMGGTVALGIEGVAALSKESNLLPLLVAVPAFFLTLMVWASEKSMIDLNNLESPPEYPNEASSMV